jgi:micrococcal nuclease
MATRRRRGRRRRSARSIPTGALLALVLGLALLTRGPQRDDGAGGLPPVLPGSPAAGPAKLEANATVTEVVDGDTVVVDIDGPGGDDERLRLIGIDTPESVATDRPNECFGKEASAQTAALLPVGTPVRIERDVEPRDRYDRLLGYVYRASDGLFVNEDLVTQGFAEAKAFAPNTTYEPRFEAAEARARGANLGLWSACGSPDVPL